jgi:excisionase family DNA binding protein
MTSAILTTAAVAQLLDCEESTVQIRALSGELPGVKIGRSWVFPEEALMQRLNEMALVGSAARRAPAKPTAVAGAVPQPARARRNALPACLA